jgi:hypothetical protein
MLPLEVRQVKNKCLNIESLGRTNLQQIGKSKKVEEVYCGNHTTNACSQSTT